MKEICHEKENGSQRPLAISLDTWPSDVLYFLSPRISGYPILSAPRLLSDDTGEVGRCVGLTVAGEHLRFYGSEKLEFYEHQGTYIGVWHRIGFLGTGEQGWVYADSDVFAPVVERRNDHYLDHDAWPRIEPKWFYAKTFLRIRDTTILRDGAAPGGRYHSQKPLYLDTRDKGTQIICRSYEDNPRLAKERPGRFYVDYRGELARIPCNLKRKAKWEIVLAEGSTGQIMGLRLSESRWLAHLQGVTWTLSIWARRAGFWGYFLIGVFLAPFALAIAQRFRRRLLAVSGIYLAAGGFCLLAVFICNELDRHRSEFGQTSSYVESRRTEDGYLLPVYAYVSLNGSKGASISSWMGAQQLIASVMLLLYLVYFLSEGILIWSALDGGRERAHETVRDRQRYEKYRKLARWFPPIWIPMGYMLLGKSAFRFLCSPLFTLSGRVLSNSRPRFFEGFNWCPYDYYNDKATVLLWPASFLPHLAASILFAVFSAAAALSAVSRRWIREICRALGRFTALIWDGFVRLANSIWSVVQAVSEFVREVLNGLWEVVRRL